MDILLYLDRMCKIEEYLTRELGYSESRDWEFSNLNRIKVGKKYYKVPSILQENVSDRELRKQSSYVISKIAKLRKIPISNIISMEVTRNGIKLKVKGKGTVFVNLNSLIVTFNKDIPYALPFPGQSFIDDTYENNLFATLNYLKGYGFEQIFTKTIDYSGMINDYYMYANKIGVIIVVNKVKYKDSNISNIKGYAFLFGKKKYNFEAKALIDDYGTVIEDRDGCLVINLGAMFTNDMNDFCRGTNFEFYGLRDLSNEQIAIFSRYAHFSSMSNIPAELVRLKTFVEESVTTENITQICCDPYLMDYSKVLQLNKVFNDVTNSTKDDDYRNLLNCIYVYSRYLYAKYKLKYPNNFYILGECSGLIDNIYYDGKVKIDVSNLIPSKLKYVLRHDDFDCYNLLFNKDVGTKLVDRVLLEFKSFTQRDRIDCKVVVNEDNLYDMIYELCPYGLRGLILYIDSSGSVVAYKCQFGYISVFDANMFSWGVVKNDSIHR